jgi:hypothetical protein
MRAAIRAWLNFDDFVTTRMLKGVYVMVTGVIGLGIVVGVLGGLAGCAAALKMDSIRGALGSLGMTFVYVVGGVLVAVLWRVWCEVLMLAFKINENLQVVREALAGRS